MMIVIHKPRVQGLQTLSILGCIPVMEMMFCGDGTDDYAYGDNDINIKSMMTMMKIMMIIFVDGMG